MSIVKKILFLAVAALVLPASLAVASLERVDRVVVMKKERRLLLIRNGEVLKSYRVALGKNPVGPKMRQGDRRTPEGSYVVDYRKSRSRFYKALHISYPNASDLAQARKTGVAPGGDIMIHGLPEGYEDLGEFQATVNWTKGCIALSNTEMDELWQLVPDGTPIEIKP